MLFSLWLTFRVGWLVQVFALVGVLGSLWECDVTASNQGNSQWPIWSRQPCEWMGCYWEAWQCVEVQDVLQTLRKAIIAALHQQLAPQELETGWQVCVYSSLPAAAHPLTSITILARSWQWLQRSISCKHDILFTNIHGTHGSCLPLRADFHWVASQSALEGPVAFQ